jgi:3-hydroxyacyl-CoA dehydrogenase
MDIETAAVVGAGTMGAGIAMTFANAGIPVRLIDTSAESVAHAARTIERTYESAVAKGRLPPGARDERLALITTGSTYDSLQNADVVVEAVFEDMAVKRDVFARLGEVCRATAILATNTSTLDVDAVAAAAPHPERSIGMHFFSPAHVMRLLEVVRGAATSSATVAATVALGERLGKVPVVVGNCDGFVGNRMLHKYRREAELLLEAGASPAQVDGALRAFGFAMGPFEVADLAGVDIGWRAKQERLKKGPSPFRLSNVSDVLVAARRLGQKTGAGYYRYESGARTPLPDRAVDDIIAGERARLGVTRREVADGEIVERCVFALVNEGARILDEGIAASAADIDTIWLTGYGFPASRGGPLAYADSVGAATVLAAVERFAERDPAFWEPARGLKERAASGATFR